MKINVTVVDMNRRPVDAALDYTATQPAAQVNGKTGAPGGSASLALSDDMWVVSISIAPQAHESFPTVYILTSSIQ